MEEAVYLYVNIASQGFVVGASMGGIVIIIDYVITSVFSMMKGR